MAVAMRISVTERKVAEAEIFVNGVLAGAWLSFKTCLALVLFPWAVPWLYPVSRHRALLIVGTIVWLLFAAGIAERLITGRWLP